MRVEFTALSAPLIFPVLQTESSEVGRLDTQHQSPQNSQEVKIKEWDSSEALSHTGTEMFSCSSL